jgi:hypothetical protein
VLAEALREGDQPGIESRRWLGSGFVTDQAELFVYDP